jgi:hypothetical protein
MTNPLLQNINNNLNNMNNNMPPPPLNPLNSNIQNNNIQDPLISSGFNMNNSNFLPLNSINNGGLQTNG